MKAFVTGSTGLLGSNLVKQLLEQGHEITALARSPEKAHKQLGSSPHLTVVKGDIEDNATFADALRGCDVLFHTAAYFREYLGSGTDHWAKLQRINVEGTIDLLNRAEQAGINKVIYVSSSGIFDATSGEVINESTPPGPFQEQNLYFKSKVLAEQRIAEWLAKRSHALPVVLMLPTWIWGPGDAAPTAAGQLTLDFLNGKLPAIIEGRSTIVDARDVAQAMINAVEKGRSGERYIIANRQVTLEEIMMTLEKVSGVRSPRLRISYPVALLMAYASEAMARLRGTETLITVTGIRTLQDRSQVDASKAQRELGHRPRPVEDTLRDAVAWYRANQPEKIVNLAAKPMMARV
jgi:dihydroflavonol-4-reductase